MNNSVL